MPRPNKPRSIASEEALARRIAYEREARGMSYEGLASRMERVGCPIQPSAIYKIEKADPPRRITVDELVGFSRVFDIPVERLMGPPDLSAELVDLVQEWSLAEMRAADANWRLEEAWARIQSWLSEHSEHREQSIAHLREWAKQQRWRTDYVDDIAARLFGENGSTDGQ